jgi:hypothetical protein
MKSPGMTEGEETPKRSRRHPVFGCMKGTITIAPGTDLTAPACPEWAELAEAKVERIARALELTRKKQK